MLWVWFAPLSLNLVAGYYFILNKLAKDGVAKHRADNYDNASGADARSMMKGCKLQIAMYG